MWALAHRQWTAEEQLRMRLDWIYFSKAGLVSERQTSGGFEAHRLRCPADMLIHFSSGPRQEPEQLHGETPHVPTTTRSAIRHWTLLFTKSLPIISTWLSHFHNTTGDETGGQSLLEFLRILMSAKQVMQKSV